MQKQIQVNTEIKSLGELNEVSDNDEEMMEEDYPEDETD